MLNVSYEIFSSFALSIGSITGQGAQDIAVLCFSVLSGWIVVNAEIAVARIQQSPSLQEALFSSGHCY